jgi:hypothetical protein
MNLHREYILKYGVEILTRMMKKSLYTKLNSALALAFRPLVVIVKIRARRYICLPRPCLQKVVILCVN